MYIIFIVLLFLFVFMVLYFNELYIYDNNLLKEIQENMTKLDDHKINSLLNGSSINNIPNIHIMSDNDLIEKANACTTIPMPTSSYHETDHDCIKQCLNSSAKLLVVDHDETVIFSNVKLDPGKYCSIAPRPQCNTKTTLALMTVNSVVCHPKYPRVFGGKYGNTCLACKNTTNVDPRNVLWDYKKNTAVDALDIDINFNENELMPGTNHNFRYRCKFDGVDEKGNKLMEHPYDRMQPIVNTCASLIYKAHPDVKTVFHKNHTVTCDCGDVEVTRVQHLVPDDKQSLCAPRTNVYNNVSTDNKTPTTKLKRETTLIYDCFNINSPVTDVATKRPCAPEDFVEGNKPPIGTITIEHAKTHRAMIEHPKYMSLEADLESGTYIKEIQEVPSRMASNALHIDGAMAVMPMLAISDSLAKAWATRKNITIPMDDPNDAWSPEEIAA